MRYYTRNTDRNLGGIESFGAETGVLETRWGVSGQEYIHSCDRVYLVLLLWTVLGFASMVITLFCLIARLLAAYARITEYSL